VAALCKSTLNDRIDGNRANVPRAFLNFAPTGVDSKDHAPAALPSGKDLPVHFGQEGAWAQGTVWMWRWRELTFAAPARVQTSDLHTVSVNCTVELCFSAAELMPIKLLNLYWQALDSTALKLLFVQRMLEKYTVNKSRPKSESTNYKLNSYLPFVPLFLPFLFLSHSLRHSSLFYVSVLHHFFGLSLILKRYTEQISFQIYACKHIISLQLMSV
jgi:hypothetical protein